MNSDSALERGRKAFRDEAWLEAFESLMEADDHGSLGADDLERMARAAYMLGRDDDYVGALERAHQVHLDDGALPRAVRCGFWIGHNFMFRGEKTRGAGWFARSQRLLDTIEHDCVERGYLLIPRWLAEMGRGDFEDGHATAAKAAEIGDQFGDADLTWLARDEQARALLRLGRTEEGRRLVNEVLVAASAGELSPVVTGIVYCNTIAFCHAQFEVRHVREWAHALTRWCDRQPQMVAHNGLCLVHLAQILLLTGDWEKACADAGRTAEHYTRGVLNQLAVGEAHYCQGEAHRLRGDFAAAEEAFGRASLNGREAQPGLALLRLSQGKHEAAAAAIRRVISETTAPLSRARILPVYVEIMLANGNVDMARAASRELDEIAQPLECEMLEAMAAHARGVVLLAEEHPNQALIELRRAQHIWTELAAPHEVARVRLRVGLACRALGDHDTARLELEAARRSFEALGARPDLAGIDALAGAAESHGGHGLTSRELEVLRRVAAGKTNRDIAAELFISEHTVARHVQNIFAKLDVSSRTAATAFAFEHDLV